MNKTGCPEVDRLVAQVASIDAKIERRKRWLKHTVGNCAPWLKSTHDRIEKHEAALAELAAERAEASAQVRRLVLGVGS